MDNELVVGPGLLCSNFCLLSFWAVLNKVTHYAQYYAHNHCNYATVYTHFSIFNDYSYISIVRLQSVVLIFMLRCNALIFDVSRSILCSWENLCLILYKVDMITSFTKIVIKVVISMSTNQLIMTFDRLHWSSLL